ncbi:MAG: hypothetical protein PHY93_16615 [Bacteriovorax sp.]|nr:hypothetical protein [Bacteriovorax sp.]
MKNLVILSIMALSLSAGAADLLTLKENSGFSPAAYSRQVSVNETGKIVRVKRVGGAATREVLGQLSANSVQSLKDQIEKIADNAKLVDSNAPSSSVSVNKGGDKTILILAN